jgi:hypothetical protein
MQGRENMTMPMKQAIPSEQPPEKSLGLRLHPSHHVRRADFFLVAPPESYANGRIFYLINAHRLPKPEQSQQRVVRDLCAIKLVCRAEAWTVNESPLIVGQHTPRESHGATLRL